MQFHRAKQEWIHFSCFACFAIRMANALQVQHDSASATQVLETNILAVDEVSNSIHTIHTDFYSYADGNETRHEQHHQGGMARGLDQRRQQEHAQQPTHKAGRACTKEDSQ